MSHNEETANTHGVASVLDSGDEEQLSMILGSRERIRKAGVIRAGVKILKGTPSAEDRKAFDDLEKKGLSYDDIDRALGGMPKSAKTKLRPTNVDHFVVRECDFQRPTDAQFIRDNYADPDGKVRRIPIWLTQSDILSVIPHNFRAFDGGQNVRAASFYENGKLKFKYLPKGVAANAANWKVAEVNEDEQHAVDFVSKACGFQVQFGGLYRVNVVGLKTFGECIIPTRSWYGLGDAVAILKRVRTILGRFDGLVDGKHFLELVKVPESVKTPDGKTVTQHIITIDAAVDPMVLAQHAERASFRGRQAIDILNGIGTETGSGDNFSTPADLSPSPLPPDPVESESGPSPEVTGAIAAIKTLVPGMPDDHLSCFAHVALGHSMTTASVDVLRSLYRKIRDEIEATDLEAFALYCKNLFNDEKGTGN
jgi:hypothetical protein